MSEVDGAAANAPAQAERITSALTLVAEMFAAVCHAPDDQEIAAKADRSLRDLDALFARDLDALLAEPASAAA
jgi:hypothetical protein